MRKELIGRLDPRLGLAADDLHVFKEEQGHVREGLLRASDGSWYPIVHGVPCFLRGALRPDFRSFEDRHGLQTCDSGRQPGPPHPQALTSATFSDKWRRFRSYGLAPGHHSFLFDWYCKKLGLADVADLRAFYRGQQCILEVGPGSGFNTRFMAENTAGTVFAADISDGALTTFDNTQHLSNCHVVQADLMDLPFADHAFDFIIADGVLHHTPDTRAAVRALYPKVKPGGRFFFYVYKKMGPARRFCDQYIREHFSKLDPESCYAACEGLTELGRQLSGLKAQVTLTEPIPILGIPAGTHEVQRLLYYNFVKCFWNDAFDFDTNNMVNFDWYHPHHAWQHTEEEVAGWLQELGVAEFTFQPANPNGLSVLLRRPAAA
jgi:SAM-dependent methyltransferase/uncharacterized protein YbaR (Trm112 family)